MLDGMEDDRRGFLKCMTWAGTGALFAFGGGVATSVGLDSALAAPLKGADAAFYFRAVERQPHRLQQAAQR